MDKICFSTGGKNPYGNGELIELRQHGPNNFVVCYGAQTKTGLSYTAAARELGAVIMHHASCEGDLDNRMPGERD